MTSEKNIKNIVGRPPGSTKDGERSPEKMLNILRTKVWSWTCSYYLRDNDQDKHISTYALEKRAEKENFRIDARQWGRWRNGDRGMSKEGPSIWPVTHPAFHIGPWVDDGYPTNGAFIPLWLAITSEARKKKGLLALKKAWQNIPIEIWEAWAPIEDSYTDYDYVPKENTFYHTPEMYNFLLKIASSRDYAKFLPILTLTAALTCNILTSGNNRIFLFDPFPRENVSGNNLHLLRPRDRAQLLNELKVYKLTIHELLNAANSQYPDQDQYVFDCGAMSFDEYTSLRCRKTIPQSCLGSMYIGPDEICTDKDWRAFFEASSQQE